MVTSWPTLARCLEFSMLNVGEQELAGLPPKITLENQLSNRSKIVLITKVLTKHYSLSELLFEEH